MTDEMKLVGRLKDVQPLSAEAFERARSVLGAAMAVAGNPGPAPAPAPAPGPARPRRRARTLATRSAAGLAIAAAATAVTLIATSAAQLTVPAQRLGAGARAVPGRGADPVPTAPSLRGQVPARPTPQPNRGEPPDSWAPYNRLNGVAAVSAHDVWAVGSAATGRPLIEHWNGRAWKQAPGARPRGARESLLNSVAATGPADAWAVGYYDTGQTIKTLIERWNGRTWAQVASPSPGGVHGSFLLGVAAAGSSRAWAVGYFRSGQTIKTLIERWDGRAWKQVASPSPGGSHARSALSGVAVAGKSSAWAVGYYFGPPVRPLIERWDGRAWKFVASPNPGGHDGGALNAVTTVGDSGAWAAGNLGTRTVGEALIERWNGRAWQRVTSPRPVGSNGSNLTAITAHSPASAWAVGYYFARTNVEPAVLTLIERWNGRAWKLEPSPSPGGSTESGPDQSLLQAVGAVSPSQAWAAGSFSSGSPRGKVLIERRTGGAWSQVPAARQ